MADSSEREVVALRARVAELEQRLGRLAEAEEQILGARAQAQALLDNIPHMAWMKNTEGVFLAVNEPFAQALRPREAATSSARPTETFGPIEHAEKYMQDDLRVISSDKKFFVEEAHRRERRRQVVRDLQDSHSRRQGPGDRDGGSRA